MHKNIEYITIAIDVVGSRTFLDKNEIRIKLKKICNVLNAKYGEHIVIQFQIKGGDSIVGVLSSFSSGFTVYRHIRRLAWRMDLKLYYGLGFGTLDTGTVTDVEEINGSSVINAFTALDYAKQDESQKDSHVRFFSYDDLEVIPYETINMLVRLIYTEFCGKTGKQRELIKIIELNPKSTLESIGEQIGYMHNAKENVSKLLHRANYRMYKELQENVIDLLKKMQRILK